MNERCLPMFAMFAVACLSRVVGLESHPLEFAMEPFQFGIRQILQIHQAGARAFDSLEQLVEFQMDRSAIAVLRVLNQKHNQKRNDSGRRIDHELPGVREIEQRPGKTPDNDQYDGGQKCRRGAYDLAVLWANRRNNSRTGCAFLLLSSIWRISSRVIALFINRILSRSRQPWPDNTGMASQAAEYSLTSSFSNLC